jgi:hypothetical protein
VTVVTGISPIAGGVTPITAARLTVVSLSLSGQSGFWYPSKKLLSDQIGLLQAIKITGNNTTAQIILTKFFILSPYFLTKKFKKQIRL